jgi:AraC-like DNA-binding protein
MVLNYGIFRGAAPWEVQEISPPGYSRIYFVTGGEGHCDYEDNRLTFRKDHLYLLPTSIPYSLWQSEESPFTCTFLHYDFFPHSFKKMVDIDLSQHGLLTNIKDAMDRAIELDDDPVFNSLAEVLVVYCTNQNLITFSSGILTPLFEYIREHIKDDLSLTTLSGKAGYNEQYFIRLFKKETGVTPLQYVISYRIKEARKLLIQGKSVTETAYQTGFTDMKTFSRCFKKRSGFSPSAYKKGSASGP